MHEWSLARVKVEPRSTSRLSSELFILPLLYLRDQNLRALTSVAQNASVEINPKWNMILNCLMKHRRADMTIILTDETLVFVLHLYHFSVFGYQMKHPLYRCSTPYIGWVCYWITPSALSFFSGYTGFPLPSKTNIFKFQFHQDIKKHLATSESLFFYFIYHFHCVWISAELKHCIFRLIYK